MDAVQAGVSVMLFSDNVSLEQEIALKDEAARHDVLVMGPDCGTAVVGGLGLGFANALRPGPVGMVAASGTGAQEVTCLLDADDIGVTAVLGVEDATCSVSVAGRSTLAAMKALDDHVGTEFIVVLSKPPDPQVAEQVRAAARQLKTPSLVAFVGRGQEDLAAATGGSSLPWAEHLHHRRSGPPPTTEHLGMGSSAACSQGGPFATRRWPSRLPALGQSPPTHRSSRPGFSTPSCGRRDIS